MPQDRAPAARPVPTERQGAAAVDLAVDLVGLDTVNPELEPGGGGERPAVALLAARLAAAGFECEVICPPGRRDRSSLLATHGVGTGSRKPLLLNGHLDTVGVSGMTDPFAARVVGDRRTGRLFGRGACDMKGGVA